MSCIPRLLRNRASRDCPKAPNSTRSTIDRPLRNVITMPASASTSKIFAPSLMLHSEPTNHFLTARSRARQYDPKNRPPIDLSLILQGAPVHLDYSRRNRKPKAGPCLFGGKKRIEQPLLHFRR